MFVDKLVKVKKKEKDFLVNFMVVCNIIIPPQDSLPADWPRADHMIRCRFNYLTGSP